MRVFPDRFKTINPTQPVDNQKQQPASNQVADGFQELLAKNQALETENLTLKDRLKAAEIAREQAEWREQWFRNHIDKLTEENTRLLPAPNQKSTSWVAKLFGSK